VPTGLDTGLDQAVAECASNALQPLKASFGMVTAPRQGHQGHLVRAEQLHAVTGRFGQEPDRHSVRLPPRQRRSKGTSSFPEKLSTGVRPVDVEPGPGRGPLGVSRRNSDGVTRR